MRRVVLLFAASIMVFASAATGADEQSDYAAAADAYRGGDMVAALAAFTVLAEDGVVAAQENLAHMYANGEGVPADLTRAADWLTRAAEGGSIGARMTLGALYFHGEGVAADPVVAYAWFSLASAGGDQVALAYLYKVAEQLSPQDIDRARVLARQMWEQFGLRETAPAG